MRSEVHLVRLLRTVLVLGTLASALVALPAFPALGTPPEARLTTRDVTAWRTAAGGLQPFAVGDDWVVSDVMDAGDTVMVGADWGGSTDVEVEVRTRRNGPWSDWHELELESDDAPDPGTDEALAAEGYNASEPIWTGPADDVQVRVRGAGARPDLELHTVEISGGDGLGYVPPEVRRNGAVAQAAPSAPNVLPRSAWDPNGQCRPRSAPSHSRDVRFAVVHHTAGSLDYSPQEADDRVLADCLYHVRSRGWNDLGYNFVIDKYGRTYEGRAGGTTEAVTGGHALGFNGASTGVVLLGTFSTVDPPEVARHALRDLLAWKLDLHHVDPNGTTTEISGANTGVYRDGQIVTFPTIVGHRDLRSTSCPGDAAYGFLPWLRQSVAATGGGKLYGGPPARIDQPVIGARPTWDVQVDGPSSWRLDIQDANGVTVRSTSGATQEASLTWDLRNEAGSEVAPGRYTARFTAGDASPITTTFTVRGSTDRYGGIDPPATSAAVSTWAFADPRLDADGWPQSSVVVLASTESEVEAPLAAPVAAAYGAPLLLSPPDALPDSVANEIRRLGATTAVLVGGTADLSAQVATDLKEKAGISTVDRRAGETRYHTAGRAGWRVVERRGAGEAVLVLGEGADPDVLTGDQLVAAGYAAAFGRPLLYVKPDEPTEPVQWVLEQRSWWRVTIVGGKGVVTAALKEAVAEAAGTSNVRQLAGSSLYETAAIVAAESLRIRSTPSSDPNVTSTGQELVLASGANPRDGLVAAAASRQRGAVPLLVHPTDLDSSPAVKGFLTDNAAELVYGTAVGSVDWLDARVLRQVDSILRSAGPHRASSGDWDQAAPPEPEPTPTFEDIAESVHRGSIESIASAGITRGCTSNRYCPGGTVTRAEMASFLARANGLEPIEGQRFPDVPADHTHAGTINAIVEAGITVGFPDGTYRPDAPVTRAQMATFLARATDLEPVSEDRFEDVPGGHTHAGTINAIATADITGGCAPGRYCPDHDVSREQMATFLNNAFALDAEPSGG
ncbi:MAG: S-layer homology domain-containing protein [Nitriliruptorales bacterium]